MKLPKFKYHPDPIRTGSLKESDEVCQSCNQARGYIYHGPIYSVSDVRKLCPWCIAAGSAYAKFNLQFNTITPSVIDPENPVELECSNEAVDELLHRTPGFACFNEVEWPNHCNDFCEFHGIATVGDFKQISDAEKQRLAKVAWLKEEHIAMLQEGKDDEEQHYYFKFQCRHCGELMFQSDPD